MGDSKQALMEKRKNVAKTLATMFPKIPKTCSLLLEFFIKRESKVSLTRDPLTHFCQEQVVLHAQEHLLKLNKQVITYQDERDYVENLVGLHSLCIKKDTDVAKMLGNTIKKFLVIIGEVATSVEKLSVVPVTDWALIGDLIVEKLERMNIPKQPPFATFIPKMKDFKSTKLLGAGGFGAVYLATYKPANFVGTVKLVAMDRFSRHKQAAMDKVVVSVIRNPFLVKYYCCFCCKEAYVTIMEYIAGLDLMRVVTKENYLEVDACQIIMAQLIIAIEHMHFRGFLHRDIKVSNMLILPGGRVKTIDFDTAKECQGHYSKRVLRGYFRRTSFEFHDGESAGTIPYMATEILKRRPYGRAADWWSSGITFYKLLTGRVPFRGKNKQMLRDRIVNAPLKWPKAEEHPHSATPTAKDMTFKMLKKNPLERLGSTLYSDLRTHPFLETFKWKRLYETTELVKIASISEILAEDAKKTKVTDPDDTRKHQEIHEMTDIPPETQKALLCYASSSFKKLMLTIKASKGDLNIDDKFMQSEDSVSSGIDYGKRQKKDRVPLEGPPKGYEKVDILIVRKKKILFYADFGFTIKRYKGQDEYFNVVDTIVKDSPASRSQVLPLDVIVAVNGTSVSGATQSKVNYLINASADQMILSVMAASSYRVLTTRRDVVQMFKSCKQTSTILRRSGGFCGGTGAFGITTMEADVYDEKAKNTAKYHVIYHMGSVSSDEMLYVGDVIMKIDDTSIVDSAHAAVQGMLNVNSSTIKLDVVPISPFRKDRVIVSKLVELTEGDSKPLVSTSLAATTQALKNP